MKSESEYCFAIKAKGKNNLDDTVLEELTYYLKLGSNKYTINTAKGWGIYEWTVTSYDVYDSYKKRRNKQKTFRGIYSFIEASNYGYRILQDLIHEYQRKEEIFQADLKKKKTS